MVRDLTSGFQPHRKKYIENMTEEREWRIPIVDSSFDSHRNAGTISQVTARGRNQGG